MKRKPKAAKAPAPKPSQVADTQFVPPHELVKSAAVQNAAALQPWSVFGELDLGGLIRELRDSTREVVTEGRMERPEAMLYGQAVALQTIFTSLSRKAAANMSHSLAAFETCLRLALKAQAQCRATIETLHELKHPRPVAFVQQANIAHGPQQVNNGAPPARAGETQTAPNEQSGPRHELLEDPGASQAAGRANPGLGALETVYRAAQP